MNINEIPTSNNLSLSEIFPDENIDLSLRTRWASTTLERYQKQTIELVDQFCTDYEKKIRDMGGIGFFLAELVLMDILDLTLWAVIIIQQQD
jgi:glucosamine-6-phosphate deaminase